MKIIGLVSGTSVDGIDAALIDINGAPPRLEAKILATHHIQYSYNLREAIFAACDIETSRVDNICKINVAIGREFAQAAQALITHAGVSANDVDLISSHGQTVWHQVSESGQVEATLQMGDAATIAEMTGITVVNNFRNRDVAAGGQGAPLIGYVDWLLLRHETHWRAIQNIGGTANVTFLPPLSDNDSMPIAFDTGPGNSLLDTAVVRLTGGAQTYDKDGQMAARGTVDEKWLAEMLKHPFFNRKPPKTTGRELFGTTMALSLLAEGRAKEKNHRDIIATITALTAHSIADAYKKFAPAPIGEVILGGGGTFNLTMIDMLRQLLNPIPVRTHEEIGFDTAFKEAMMFAVLGHETWNNRPGSLPTFTGVSHPVVLGQITPGDNYVNLLRQTWS